MEEDDKLDMVLSDCAGEPEVDGEAEVVENAVPEGMEEHETDRLCEDVAEGEDAALELVVTDGKSVALPEAVLPALCTGVLEGDADAEALAVCECEPVGDAVSDRDGKDVVVGEAEAAALSDGAVDADVETDALAVAEGGGATNAATSDAESARA